MGTASSPSVFTIAVEFTAKGPRPGERFRTREQTQGRALPAEPVALRPIPLRDPFCYRGCGGKVRSAQSKEVAYEAYDQGPGDGSSCGDDSCGKHFPRAGQGRARWRVAAHGEALSRYPGGPERSWISHTAQPGRSDAGVLGGIATWRQPRPLIRCRGVDAVHVPSPPRELDQASAFPSRA